jgi:hypothetical protein
MSRLFERFAGWCAVLTAVAGVVFTVAFAAYVQDGHRSAQWVSAVMLLAGGLLTVPVVAALYATLAGAEPQFALLGLVLGLTGALGAAIHGGFDVAVLANPPSGQGPDLPNQVDPRGLLTFAVTGLALLMFGWLITRTGGLPRSLGRLAIAGAVLLVVVYLGRLIVLNPKTNLIRVAALVSGLVVLPAFYAMLGRTLLRRGPASPGDGPADAVS